jgi:hypothetical protein
MTKDENIIRKGHKTDLITKRSQELRNGKQKSETE